MDKSSEKNCPHCGATAIHGQGSITFYGCGYWDGDPKSTKSLTRPLRTWACYEIARLKQELAVYERNAG